jgi:hypothetical protein
LAKINNNKIVDLLILAIYGSDDKLLQGAARALGAIVDPLIKSLQE